jgi:clan AA aspartic protease
MQSNRRLIDLGASLSNKEAEMGEVRIKVRLTNAADESLARRGQLPSGQVRSVTVEALVDTGAVRCVLPNSVREQLGLQTTSRRNALYADGRSEEVDVTEPVRLELEGRPTYEDCLVLGDTVLIGQTALESTDLFVDCINHRLVPNPAHPNTIVSPVRSSHHGR